MMSSDGRHRRRRGHKYGTQELARDIAANSRRAAGQTIGVDYYGRATIAVRTGDVPAELVERIEQIADGPGTHSLDAVEPKRTMAQRGERGQKADRGAAVAAKQVGFERRDFATGAFDNERLFRVARFHGDP